MRKRKFRTYHLISAGNVFRITLIVILLTVCGVYFWGLGTHHTFFENGILSTTILSIAFFLFITCGLYRGIKLKNDVAPLSENIDQINFSSIPDVSGMGGIDVDLDIDEGCAGAIGAAILWFVAAILFAIFLWFLVRSYG